MSAFVNNKGFTLIEVLAVIFVITVGVTGSLVLIQSSMSSSRLVSYELTGTYLTQEGVEIIRSVRDSNWLEGDQWDQGLGNEGEQLAVDYKDLGKQDPDFESYAGRYLRMDGGYNYDTGKETPFKRKIEILKKNDLNGDGTTDEIKIKVEVSFDFQGQTHTISAQENLYRWKK